MIKNIVLDFGHGGIDKNGNYTTAPSKMATLKNGEVVYEGVINRQIGKKLYKILREKLPTMNLFFTVSPDDPTDVPLSRRVEIANQFKADETIFLSIHNNAFNGLARGFELYTSKGKTNADTLAEEIAKEVSKLYTLLDLKLRYDLSDGDKDKESDFYVLRKTKCPAVLIECLFFDSLEDYAYLRDSDFQEALALAICTGVSNYLKRGK